MSTTDGEGWTPAQLKRAIRTPLEQDPARAEILKRYYGALSAATNEAERTEVHKAAAQELNDTHPQDKAMLQHGAWHQVWEAARACEDFRDFREAMDELTLRLRWTRTRADDSSGCAVSGCADSASADSPLCDGHSRELALHPERFA